MWELLHSWYLTVQVIRFDIDLKVLNTQIDEACFLPKTCNIRNPLQLILWSTRQTTTSKKYHIKKLEGVVVQRLPVATAQQCVLKYLVCVWFVIYYLYSVLTAWLFPSVPSVLGNQDCKAKVAAAHPSRTQRLPNCSPNIRSLHLLALCNSHPPSETLTRPGKPPPPPSDTGMIITTILVWHYWGENEQRWQNRSLWALLEHYSNIFLAESITTSIKAYLSALLSTRASQLRTHIWSTPETLWEINGKPNQGPGWVLHIPRIQEFGG